MKIERMRREAELNAEKDLKLKDLVESAQLRPTRPSTQ